MKISILCPNCNGKLIEEDTKYTCTNCKKRFKIENDILLLKEDPLRQEYRFRTDRIPTSKDPTYTNFLEKYKKKFNLGLDFGCGNGKSAMSFVKYVRTYYCVEPSFDGLRMFRKREDFDKYDIKLINNLGKIPFEDNTFDFVSMISVYEHLDNPSYYLKEINRVLKNNGVFFIVNDTLFYHLINKRVDSTHISMKTPNFLERELKKEGFKIMKRGYLPFLRWNVNIPKTLSFLSTKGIFICKKIN